MKLIENIIYFSIEDLIKFIYKSVLIISIMMLTACSSIWGFGSAEKFTITEQGKNIASRPNMEKTCKGFHVSHEKFDDFFKYATITHEKTLNERYKSLPCYSSGMVRIDGEKFNWTIRAGGVGEFYSNTSNFTKVCGIACCSKVNGVC